MSLTSAPSSERIHIGFFGLRNAGKSSLVNAVSSQSLSIVSPTAGTTTDTVQKAMELLPLGPVVLLDTPGFDDEGELGTLRVRAAKRALDRTDLAVLVTDATRDLCAAESEFLATLKAKNVPHLIVCNKCDLVPPEKRRTDLLYVSAASGEGIEALKTRLAQLNREKQEDRYLLRDLIHSGDTVLLVTPIDSSAPKGRIILPQQRTLRELLDSHAIPLFCQPEETAQTLALLKQPPRLVVTDSQAFSAVAEAVPESIPLTSFSILFARCKGDLEEQVRAAAVLKQLTDSSHVLISEGCTHHRQCADIGTVKLPGAVRRMTGADPEFHFTSGHDFPEDTSAYDLIIHCGACMLGETEVKSRLSKARENGTPMTNYGLALAMASGILHRALSPFGKLADLV